MKLLKYILFIFVFLFFINIDVNAATWNELTNHNYKTLSNDDKICVFFQGTNPQNDFGDFINSKAFDYIVVKFSKSESLGSGTVYQLTDLTLALGEYVNKTYIVNENGENTISVNSNFNCNDYYVYVIPAFSDNPYNEATIYLTKNRNNHIVYQYNSAATNEFMSVITQTESNLEVNNCVIDGTTIKLSSYATDGYGLPYFDTTDNKKICPADVKDKIIYTRKNIDINSFKCGEWKIVNNFSNDLMNAGNAYNCDSFLVDKDADTHTEGTIIEVEGTYVTTYVAYKHPNAPSIRIVKQNDGSYIAMMKTAKGEKEITISNISKYKTNFSSSDLKSYPSYINFYKGDKKDTGVYKIDTEKDKKASNVYMEVHQIGSIAGLGESAIIETCEELLGSTFIKFLKENVFKIIYIAVPIILVALTSFDFAKVVFIDDKEGINKSFKRFGKRCIASVVIYLIPTILIFVTNIFQSDKIASCARDFKEIAESNK